MRMKTIKLFIISTIAIFFLSIASVSFADKNIVDIAASQEKLSTVVKALKTAELVDTLKGKGPFTVFAPSDEAFAKLPEKLRKKLLEPASDKYKKYLVRLLTYHVVGEKFGSGDIAGKAKTVKTVEGSDAKIDATKDVMYESAKVTKADLKASNGVIHVIDTVILPPEWRGSFAEKFGNKEAPRGSNTPRGSN